jgi:uncharacterized membrane protein YdjX (TVP38/TMEM64 family)
LISPGGEPSPIAVFSSPAARTRTLLLVAGLAVLSGLLALLAGRFLPWFTDPTTLRALLADAGPLAPVAFVLVTALSVVLAPVPGVVLALAGGYLFGWFLGALYGLVGAVIGSVVALVLARRFGRPYAEHVVVPSTLDRFDDLVGAHGDLVLLVAFLLPGLPDDALCFLAGLTPIPLRRFVVLLVLGRAPAYLVVSVAGAGLATGHVLTAGVVIAAVGLLSVVGYRYGEGLMGAARTCERGAYGLPKRYA